MNEYPLVSLIIPVYNVELYIERCLLSALNQTYQNIEIILIDDCGKDNSIVIAQQIIENHPNGYKVRILNLKHNKGPSIARNIGIESALGEYLYFLDSDDELILSALESLIKNLSNCEIIIAEVLTSNMKPYSICENKILKGNEILESYFKDEIHSMACDKLISTKFIRDNKLRFKEGILHEDYLWTFQLISCATQLRTINIPVYIYHIRANTRNTNFTLKNIRDYLYGYNIIKSHTFENYMNISFSNDYLIDFAFGLACLSIKECKCTYHDYINLNIFDDRINYFKIIHNKTKIKYLFFKFPLIIQHAILKLLK